MLLRVRRPVFRLLLRWFILSPCLQLTFYARDSCSFSQLNVQLLDLSCEDDGITFLIRLSLLPSFSVCVRSLDATSRSAVPANFLVFLYFCCFPEVAALLRLEELDDSSFLDDSLPSLVSSTRLDEPPSFVRRPRPVPANCRVSRAAMAEKSENFPFPIVN